MRENRLSVALMLVFALMSLVCGPLAAAPHAAAAQGDPTVAPPAQLSADGRTAAVAGGPSLTVSQASGLADGQPVSVSGSAFDVDKGIYVALCAIPPANHAPSPCGGGQDREGGAGVSTWISSNPPAYGADVAVPYGPGGSFSTTFSVSAMISPTIDCRVVACAIVTRNDHTRSSDRSQDLFVPVSFAAPGTAPTTAPPTSAPPTTAPTTTTTTTTTTIAAPAATVADDGLSVSDGVRTMAASTVTHLDPTGAEVEITGSGYSPDSGVLVALCAVAADGGRPGPCTAGSVGASAWISSSPPDYAADLAEPYDDGGTFAVTLTVPAVIDADTDCREVACAITTRADDTNPDDRSQELALPVSFDDDAPAESTTTTADEADRPTADADDDASSDDSSSTPWLPVALAVVVVIVAGAVIVWRRRAGGAGTTTEAVPTDPGDDTP